MKETIKEKMMMLIMFGLSISFILLNAQIAAAQTDGKIAFTSLRDGNGEIYVMNADGSDQTRLTNNTDLDSRPSFSPDGSRIVFVRSLFVNFQSNYEIYVINADGTNETRLTNHSAFDSDPSFSPDGSEIVFMSSRDGNGEIYVMNADGTNQTRLTDNTTTDNEPSFSPDGSKIVFASDRDGAYSIYVMNADGTNEIRLTYSSLLDSHPSFSPDGSKIVFSSHPENGNSEIYVMNADGSDQIRLTNNTNLDSRPSFSPDGNKIAFDSNRDGNHEIYVMNADGTNETRITNNSESDLQPSWGRTANTAPIINAPAVTLARDSSLSMQIGAVWDAEQSPDTLSVSALPLTGAGITLSNIAVDSLGNVTANVAASCGATDSTFELEVTDNGNLTASANLFVAVTAETGLPVINMSSLIIKLFPNNHKYNTIEVSQLVASVSDNCSALSVSDVQIAQVTSDEVDDAPGNSDGNTINDIVIAADCRSVKLRAERDGNRNGRVYTITLRLRDAAGNEATATKQISVPLSQNGSPAIDDGAAYTVISDCS